MPLTISRRQMNVFYKEHYNLFISRLYKYFSKKYPDSHWLMEIEGLLKKSFRYHFKKEKYVKDFIEFYFKVDDFESKLVELNLIEFIDSADFDEEFKLNLLKSRI